MTQTQTKRRCVLIFFIVLFLWAFAGAAPAANVDNVTVSGGASIGETVPNGGDYVLNVSNDVTVTSTAAPSAVGVSADAGAVVTVGGAVSAERIRSRGIWAESASIDVANGVVASGMGAYGIYAESSSMDVAGGITASGEGALGIYASSSSIDITGDVVASGSGSYGIYGSLNNTISVTGNVTASNTETEGIYAHFSSVDVSGTVSATTAGAVGIWENGSTTRVGALSASNGGVGADLIGGSSVLTVAGLLTVSGDGSVGVNSTGSATINLAGAQVTGGTGVIASGAANVVFSEDVVVSDDTGIGAIASNGASVTMQKDLIVTDSGTGAIVESRGRLAVVGSTDVTGAGSTGAVVQTGGAAAFADVTAKDGATGVVTSGTTSISDIVSADGGSIGLEVLGGDTRVQQDIFASGDAYGAKVSGGTLIVDGIVTAGASSYGVLATSGDAYVSSVDVTGPGAYGVYASRDGKIYVSEDITMGDLAAGSYGAFADTGGEVYISGDLTSTAVGPTLYNQVYGLYASKDGTIIMDGNIDMDGNRSFAATADGGNLTVNGSIDVKGERGVGANAINGGEVVVVGNITMSGDITYGARAMDGSSIDITGDINTSGKYAHGASAHESSYIGVAGNIQTSSNDSYGVLASNNSTANMTGNIQTSGDWAYGARAFGSSSIDLTGNIVTSGALAYAVYADGGGTTVKMTGNITTFGEGAQGVRAEIGAYADLTGNIETSGAGSEGIYANSANTYVRHDGTIVTRSDDAYGVYAFNRATIVQSGDITTWGDLSYGAYADNRSSIDVSGDILTFGGGAHAAYASGDSTITIDGSGDYRFVETGGAGSYTLYADNNGTVNLTNGQIKAASNDTSWFTYANSGGTINLDQVTVDASDSLHLLQTDSTGTVNANNSLLFGDITHTGLNAGSLDVNLTGGTKFIGAANASEDNAGAWINITLDAISDDFGATDYWQVTKDSNMQGDLTNRGMIDFVHATSADFNGLNAYVVDDSAYKKITINDFFGTVNSDDMLGQLVMKADINAGKGDSIYGVGAATGNNEIDLQIMSYTSKERMDQALVYVEDGANSDAVITLMDNQITTDGIADAGAWNYILEEGMDGAAKEWYLKRNGLTVLGQGLVMGAVTPELWYTEVATLYDRMGDYKNPQYKGGIWASASYRKVEFDGEGGAFGMLPFDVKMKTLTVGYDQKNNHSNGTWYHGFMLGYGKEERDNWAADADTDSMHLSIYTVYKKESGFYLSALAKYNHYDTDLTVNKVDKLTQQFGYDQVTGGLKQRGLGISMMTGKRFNMGEQGWYWEPQMQLSYMRIFGDKFITNSGLDVDIEATTSLRARAGFLFGKAFQLQNGHQLDLFADLSYNKEFDGETDIWLSGGKYTRDLGDAWGSYGLGFSWKMGERSYLGGRIAYGSGSDRTEPISATLGLLFETN